MSTGHAIDHLDVRWVPRGVAGPLDGTRLDRLLQLLVDRELESVFEDLDAGRDAEVCIKAVSVAYRFRWTETDSQVLAGWGRAIGDAVATVVRDGSAGAASTADEVVVVYRSAVHAVADLAARALVGDVGRAWAWRQLDLWPDRLPSGSGVVADEVVAHVVDLLARHPAAAVPALVSLAARGHLVGAVAALGPRLLAEVVAAAWRAAGGRDLSPPPATSGDVGDAPGLALAAILGRSTIATAWRTHAPTPAAVPGPTGAALDVAAADAPGPAPAADAPGPAPAASATPAPAPGTTPAVAFGRSIAAIAVLEAEPAAARQADAAALVTAVADTLPPFCHVERGTSYHVPHDKTGLAEGPALVTEWGGLLFLLHVVDHLGLPEQWAGDGLRELLWRVGDALLTRAAEPGEAVASTDPALLAFCGLGPEAAAPATGAAPADVVDVVHAAVDAIVAEAAARLDLHDRDVTHALRLLCRRRATIDAEPGWIDIVLDLDEVSTEVRRSGLDLDLGYVAWLGAAVRFLYA